MNLQAVTTEDGVAFEAVAPAVTKTSEDAGNITNQGAGDGEETSSGSCSGWRARSRCTMTSLCLGISAASRAAVGVNIAAVAAIGADGAVIRSSAVVGNNDDPLAAYKRPKLLF